MILRRQEHPAGFLWRHPRLGRLLRSGLIVTWVVWLRSLRELCVPCSDLSVNLWAAIHLHHGSHLQTNSLKHGSSESSGFRYLKPKGGSAAAVLLVASTGTSTSSLLPSLERHLSLSDSPHCHSVTGSTVTHLCKIAVLSPIHLQVGDVKHQGAFTAGSHSTRYCDYKRHPRRRPSL